MTKTVLSALIIALTASTAIAQTLTYKDGNGTQWTVDADSDAPITAWHGFDNIGNLCPTHHLRFDAVKADAGGAPMTREQKARGDRRWHMVCIRTPAAAPANPPAPTA